MADDWFKIDHPDWVRGASFGSGEATSLGKLAGVSPGTVRLYVRTHHVSEGLAEAQLIELLTYAAQGEHVYQHRTLPRLRAEARFGGNKYGVLLDLPSVRIISYRSSAFTRTWAASRTAARLLRSA